MDHILIMKLSSCENLCVCVCVCVDRFAFN